MESIYKKVKDLPRWGVAIIILIFLVIIVSIVVAVWPAPKYELEIYSKSGDKVCLSSIPMIPAVVASGTTLAKAMVPANDNIVVAKKQDKTDSQLWRMTKIDLGFGNIKNVSSGFVMDYIPVPNNSRSTVVMRKESEVPSIVTMVPIKTAFTAGTPEFAYANAFTTEGYSVIKATPAGAGTRPLYLTNGASGMFWANSVDDATLKIKIPV
jgi:hypothetical protein